MAPKSEVPFRVCLFCGNNTEGPLGVAWALYWSSHLVCVRSWLELGAADQAAATLEVAAGFRALVVAQYESGVLPSALCPLCGDDCGDAGPGALQLRWSAHAACLASYVVETGIPVSDDAARVTMLLRALACRPPQRPGNGQSSSS